MAPEVVRQETLLHPHAADVYSFGVTFWKTIFDFEGLPMSEDVSLRDDRDPVLHSILSHAERRLYAITGTLPGHELLNILRHTMASHPKKRNLGQACEWLDHWALQELDSWPPSFSTSKLKSATTFNLQLDYDYVTSVSGIVQDQLMANLTLLAATSDSFRHNDALYELGVFHLSKIGDPSQCNSHLGLKYIFLAASKGHTSAKAYFQRLAHIHAQPLQTFASHHDLPDFSQWLIDAAADGYEVAMDELRSRSGALSARMLVNTTLAKRLTAESFEAAQLYQAVLTDNIEALSGILDQNRSLLELRDGIGDTILHKAVKWSNMPAIHLLLKLGVDANSLNLKKETALHHIWRFSDEKALPLVDLLIAAGCDFEALALPGPELAFHDSDTLPTLPGRAVERAAGRGRVALVKKLLTYEHLGNGAGSTDVLSLISWACRFNFPELRSELLKLNQNYSVQRQMYTWAPADQSHHFMSAAAEGWTGPSTNGWSKPDVFWRMCCHGDAWESNLESTILELHTISGLPLCQFDQSLLWATTNARPSFVKLFLRLYLQIHGPVYGPSSDDDRGMHKCTRYIDPDRRLCGFDFPEDAKEACLPLRLEDSNYQSSSRASASLSNSDAHQRHHDLDMVCFFGEWTLVQNAIIRGDRLIFWILVQELQADPRRPWTFPKAVEIYTQRTYMSDRIVRDIKDRRDKSSRDIFEQLFGSPTLLTQQADPDLSWLNLKAERSMMKFRFMQTEARNYAYLNCYSLSACFSADVWFAKTFHQILKVPHGDLGSGKERQIRYCTPRYIFAREDVLWDMREYLPPLFHAISHGNYRLALLLISFGASFDDLVCDGVSVLDRVLHQTTLRQDTLRFLFHTNSPLSSPEVMHSSRFLPVLRTANDGSSAIAYLDRVFDAPVGRDFSMSVFKKAKKYYYFNNDDPVSEMCLVYLLGRFFCTFFPHVYLVSWIYRHSRLWLALKYVPNMLEEFSTAATMFHRSVYTVRELSRHWSYLLSEGMFPRPKLVTQAIIYSRPPGKILPQAHFRRSSLLSTLLAAKRACTSDILQGSSNYFWCSIRDLVTGNGEGSGAEKIDTSLAPIRRKYLELLEQQIPENGFTPSLVDIFLSNELDWWKFDPAVAQLLCNRGWRHSMMFFAETYLIGIVVYFYILTHLNLYVRTTVIPLVVWPGTSLPIIGYDTVIHKPGTLMPWDYVTLFWSGLMFVTWSVPVGMWLFIFLLGEPLLGLFLPLYCVIAHGDRDRFAIRAIWTGKWMGYDPRTIVWALWGAMNLPNPKLWIWRKGPIRLEGEEGTLLSQRSGITMSNQAAESSLAPEDQRIHEAEERQQERERQEEERRRRKRERDRKNRELAERMAKEIKRAAKRVAEAAFNVLSWPIKLADWANRREAARIAQIRARSDRQYSNEIIIGDWAE